MNVVDSSGWLECFAAILGKHEETKINQCKEPGLARLFALEDEIG